MSRLRNNALRPFGMIAVSTVASFALSVAFELAIGTAQERSKAARTEIARIEAALERAEDADRWTAQLERNIAALHLRDTTPQQCALVVTELRRLSVRHGLQLTAILGQPSPSLVKKSGSTSDSYEVTFQGPYTKTLLALASFADFPLVTSIKAVTFERLPARHGSVGDVRTSILFEVFRMTPTDAAHAS